MSAREWKPGDVAQYDGTLTGRMMHTVDGWRDTEGEYRDPAEHALRPLVVIDPEDREAARRLLETYGRQFASWTPELDRNVDRLQVALREFANPTPPKPAEPTGLGAVVGDAEGRVWVRGDNDDIAWVHGGEWRRYAEINAVQVLSKGWVA